jgi:hypothetical protein
MRLYPGDSLGGSPLVPNPRSESGPHFSTGCKFVRYRVNRPRLVSRPFLHSSVGEERIVLILRFTYRRCSSGNLFSFYYCDGPIYKTSIPSQIGNLISSRVRL